MKHLLMGSTKFAQIKALGLKLAHAPGVIDFPYMFIVKTLKKSSLKEPKELELSY
jgi:hypothetical protein